MMRKGGRAGNGRETEKGGGGREGGQRRGRERRGRGDRGKSLLANVPTLCFASLAIFCHSL